MKHIMWRVYNNYEKEEAWLNEMAAKGLAFTDFFLCRYVFEDRQPGEYIYRIELLENHPGHAESQKYLDFMAENGVEHMASWHRWVYFRKKAQDGPFDIYSDIDSKMAHYKRIGMLFLPLGLAQACFALTQLSYLWGYLASSGSSYYSPLNLFAFCVCATTGAILLWGWNTSRRKIKRLRLEKNLRE